MMDPSTPSCIQRPAAEQTDCIWPEHTSLQAGSRQLHGPALNTHTHVNTLKHTQAL